MPFAVAFFFGWMFGMNAVLLSLELRLPSWLSVPLIFIGVIPIVIVYVALIRFRLGHALGLIQSIPTQAVLDAAGIELSRDGSAPELYRWDDIVAMERLGKDWRLVGLDESTVAAIPAGLARPRPSWSDAPTLAEAVVDMRPDRFALRGGTFEPGMTEFALRQPNDPVDRPMLVMRYDLLVIGIVLFLLAFCLLVIMLGQPP